MRNRLTILALAFIAATMLAAPASAQVLSRQHTAHIPFAFKIGNATLPAGTYQITLVGAHMQLHALNGKNVAITESIPTTQRRASEVSHLKFDRRGDEMYLTNVYYAGGTDGIELLQNKVQAASRMQ